MPIQGPYKGLSLVIATDCESTRPVTDESKSDSVNKIMRSYM